MNFLPQKLAEVVLIERQPFKDSRGVFSRLFCNEELKQAGLDFHIDQINLSINAAKGTLRGFHIQKKPFAEAKILTVIEGSIYNVVLDLRKESATYLQSQSFELDAYSNLGLLVPKGCANAFMTLEDNTQVLYLMDGPYKAESGFGIRFNDPQFNVTWPFEPVVISDKDRDCPNFVTSTWEG